MIQLHIGIVGQQTDLWSFRETHGCGTAERIAPISLHRFVGNHSLWCLATGVPEVLILLMYTIHVDGQVTVPIGAFFHTCQSREICHEQTVLHESCKWHNLLHPQHLCLCVKVLQLSGDEITHGDRITFLHMQAPCSIIRKNDVLPPQWFSPPLVHCCHKGIRDGVCIMYEVIYEIGKVEG